MWSVESELEAALKELKPSVDAFSKMDDAEAARIVAAARGRFVDGNPRTWWLSLKIAPAIYKYEFPSDHLRHHIPSHDGKCFWIPESEKPILDVYNVEVDFIPRILELTAFFEYYALSKSIDHLAIESDHGELLVVSYIAG